MTVLVVNGQRQPVDTPRERDRAAMRRLLADAGFEHAPGSCATPVAVAVVAPGRDVDERLERVAEMAEAAVLDALVYFARARGWKGADG